MKNEGERIALLRTRFAGDAAKAPTGNAAVVVRLGIGDDAAVLAPAAGITAGEPLVWTIDAQVEGTHFRREWLDWQDIGWRSFMAAASDLAAMGASPVAALSSLVLAENVDDEAFDSLVRGQAHAAQTIGAPIVGGNLARGNETSITTTLLGSTDRPITRAGAKPGDAIYLGGVLGMAGAGLALLLEAKRHVQDAHMQYLAAWRRPTARIDLGLVMRAADATAAIDISDGLALDASHVATASGVRLVLSETMLRSAVVSTALIAAAALTGRDPLELVLYGGEDYALLTTARADAAALEGFVRVGVVEAASGPPDVILDRVDGTRSAIDPIGFDHFAKR